MPKFVLLLVLLCSVSVQAAVPSTLELKLRSEINAHLSGPSRSNFEPLLDRWAQESKPSLAAKELAGISANPSHDDPVRYIALQGAVRLGGPEIAPALTTLLKDRSWMLRSGALRSLGLLKNPATANAVLPLLKDKALVVRMEAVEAVASLNPPGAVEALLASLKDKENYHKGKALWVPAKALKALSQLPLPTERAARLAHELYPLLNHDQDPALQAATIEALSKLSGPSKAKLVASLRGKPLKQQLQAWKKSFK